MNPAILLSILALFIALLMFIFSLYILFPKIYWKILLSILVLFTGLVLFIFSSYVIGSLTHRYESGLVRNQPEAFEISTTLSYKYTIRDKEGMTTDPSSKNSFHDIFLDRITVKDYKNENIEDCPANNYGKNKKITLHYSRRLLYFIPLEFYKIQCKT
jgi:glucan phosphoethanolaminetransferase (alkaline phosphatase superfamily)